MTKTLRAFSGLELMQLSCSIIVTLSSFSSCQWLNSPWTLDRFQQWLFPLVSLTQQFGKIECRLKTLQFSFNVEQKAEENVKEFSDSNRTWKVLHMLCNTSSVQSQLSKLYLTRMSNDFMFASFPSNCSELLSVFLDPVKKTGKLHHAFNLTEALSTSSL